MISRLHARLGTAGFIISIVALVAALGGGAYAASGGLTGKEKKEVEKIAKKYAGKPGKNGKNGATGPQGATGATGAAGAKGDTGGKGDTGPEGPAGGPGSNGASVTSRTATVGECIEGGTAFEINGQAAGKACNGGQGQNGQPGQPWTPESQLPEGATETGIFAGSGVYEPFSKVTATASFTVPLSEADAEEISEEVSGAYPHIHVLAKGAASTTECGGTVDAPAAAPGELCIYTAETAGLFGTEALGVSPPSVAFVTGEGGAGTSGAVVLGVKNATEGFAQIGGSWAVTASEAAS